jgi:hypothetical protein
VSKETYYSDYESSRDAERPSGGRSAQNVFSINRMCSLGEICAAAAERCIDVHMSRGESAGG